MVRTPRVAACKGMVALVGIVRQGAGGLGSVGWPSVLTMTMPNVESAFPDAHCNFRARTLHVT